MPSTAKKEPTEVVVTTKPIDYVRIAHKVARGYKQTETDHDDMVGYILLETMRYLSKWDRPIQKASMYFRFARFRAIDYWRAHYNRKTRELRPGFQTMEATEWNQGSYEMKYDDEGFEGLIKGLQPRERRILRLRYVDGLTQHETAKRVGISASRIAQIELDVLQYLRDTHERD